MLTTELAKLVTETPSAAISAEMLDRATQALVDSVGCAIAGTQSDVARATLAFIGKQASECGLALWGLGEHAAPPEAAFFNAVAGHALDFDDSLPILRGHPSVPIFAAALAVSDRQVSGRVLLEAYVVALEVAAKLGLALGHTHYTRGWHITATVGAFSAAAVVGRLLGLDERQMRNAFGLAAADSAGLIRNFGTMAKAVQAGRSARAGYVAARLAALGVTADPSIFDGEGGFLTAYTEGGPAEWQRLKGTWAILDPGIYVKRWPCCYANHRALAGIFELVCKNGLEAGEIEEIAVGFLPDADKALVHSSPKTGLEGKFSIEYCAAAAVLDGAIGLGSFTDAAVERPEVRSLMKRVRRFAMPGVGSFSGVHGYTDVEISTARGTFGMRVEHTPGSLQAPMSQADRHAKFLDCVVPILGASAAERLFLSLSKAASAPDAARLFDRNGAECGLVA